MGDDERARFEVLLEDIRTTVGVIAEGHTALAVKLDGVASDVAVLKTDVGVLKTDVAVLKTDMAGVKQRLGRIERHIGLNGVGGAPAPRRPRKKR